MAGEKRKDKNGYVLRRGECYRSDGRYSFAYTDKEKQVLRDRDDGLDVSSATRMTLNDLIDRYLSQKFNLKPTTLAGYVYNYESYIKDGFGKRRIYNYNNIIYTNPILSIKEDEMDGMEEYQAYSEIIRENIEYDSLCERHPYEREVVEGIVDLILETMISKKDSVLVSGQEYPEALVKSKFLKLNYSHIEYVMGCMGKNTTKVRNIKAYLMAALFNAGSTMGSYYKAEVNHDMPQFVG